MVVPGLAGDVTANITSAGTSPDGRAIAYAVDGTLTVLDLARQRVLSLSLSSYGQLKWSPDGARLAVGQDVDQKLTISLLDLATAKLTDITPHDLTRPIIQGWRADGALILETADPNFTVVTLWAENIQTKTARQITQIPIGPQNAAFTITIAPNGAACVYYTWQFQSNPFTPLVEMIDLATGALHTLPNITKTTGANFDPSVAAWRADGAQLAMAAQGLPNQPRPIWILDLAHDTATHGTNSVSPVGWAPDGGALILSTTEVAALGDPPHELSLLPLPLTSHATPTRLTDSAAVFPFLGFVRGG